MWASGITTIMVAFEILEVGMNTANKAALSEGLSQFILVLYSNIIAIFLLLSSSFLFYRKRTIPPLTRVIMCRIFILAILSCVGQVSTYIGLGYSSPTLASAMTDLTPAFTFALAIITRMERLNLRVKSSQAKSIGTVILITGGLVVTLYKGLPIVSNLSGNINLLGEKMLSSPSNDWAIGGFILGAHSVVLALIYNTQTWIIRDYPAELIMTLVTTIFVAILSAMVSLIVVKDTNAWKIKPDIELIAIGYSAVVAAAFRSVVHTWACRKKGPVYASMFKPLGMVIAVFMGVSFLGDTLYLGSVIGAVIIAIGFYAVIWGKTQEEKTEEDKDNFNFQSSSSKVSLLQDKSVNA